MEFLSKEELDRLMDKDFDIKRLEQVVLQVVEGFMDSVKSSMINGEEVYLRGFGSFIIKHRAEKTARNISRNTTVIVPAHNIPAFKPSKAFAGRMKSDK